MSSLNQQLMNVRESATVQLADRVRQLQSAGRRITGLQMGDPDFATPAPIIDAAYSALKSGQTHYTHSRGIPELRAAAAGWLRDCSLSHYEPDSEILATNGGVHAYYCGLMAITNPGDEVLIPDPAWMSHANLVSVVRGVPVRVPSLAENNFFPTLDAWEKAVTPRTTALVINSPNNPTGGVASREYLLELNRFAARHNLWVISDEVYETILYDGQQHVSFTSLPGAKERTLLVNSLSKTYAMTGWRVGYLAAPAEVINQALKASQASITNLPPFIQKAAAFALTSKEMQAETRGMVAAYARRRSRVLQMWLERGVESVKLVVPQGAFYFFIDLRALGLTSAEISNRLLD